MVAPTMETWVLTFFLILPPNSDSDWFMGGEYQTKARCEKAAAMQAPVWRPSGFKHYRCELRKL